MTLRRCLVLALACATVAPPLAAIGGSPDELLAATLLVPLVEVGRDAATHPQNTLFTVHNGHDSDEIVHWELWTIDGRTTEGMWGNTTIPARGTWSGNAYDLLVAQATGADLVALTDGDFYRGFMTIDLVTSTSEHSPFSGGYPFKEANFLSGSVYYTRLAQGSSNGLAMIGIEALGSGAATSTVGFYGSPVGRRERIDVGARSCVDEIISVPGTMICLPVANVGAIESRVFLEPSLSGASRVVVFAWDTASQTVGGPSAQCQADPQLGCADTYLFRRLRGDGTIAESGSLGLPHVVNVIEVTGTGSGSFEIFTIPNTHDSLQIYAFAINSAASPVASLNWDAIFPSRILY